MNDLEVMDILPLSERKNSNIYEVRDPNPYSATSGKKKIIQVKILEVLYDEQVCNLVFMQDLT